MENKNNDTKPVSRVTTSIILDSSYIFLALYNKLEGQWKKKTNKDKHKNSYFDGYEFINYYFENIPMYISDLITTTKMQYNVDNKTQLANVYITKGSRTSWRNNVISDYASELPARIIPLLEIIIRKEIGIKDCKLYEGFNLESNDCVALLTKKLREKDENMFIHIISNNKRLIQLNSERTTITNINNEQIHLKSKILSESIIFTPNKYLFFLILKGDADINMPCVFFDEKTDMEYDEYYDNNDMIVEECQDIILAERLRNNYLICDYNSIPKKLIISFNKNNNDI